MNQLAEQIASLMLLLLVAGTSVSQSTLQVEIQSLDIVNESISITDHGKTRKLPLAPNVVINVESKKTDFAFRPPGDVASLTCNKRTSAVTSIASQRALIDPAEKLAEGWDRIDDCIILLLLRFASTEASLEAKENAIAGSNCNHAKKTGQAMQADKKNEDMDHRSRGNVQNFLS